MASTEDTDYFPTYPAINSASKDLALVKRGEYLAKAGDCIACHTNTLEKGKPFAGGLPMRTPFGTIYSPNLTSDKETGIGNWTDEQFIKAMRHGVAPNHSYYYPAFPYLYFANVTDDDLKAIKAYLNSVPAVKQENRANEMVFPFNIRLLQLPWRILFFHPHSGLEGNTLGSVMDYSEKIKRGAYLVEGLGHCAMCHTPSYNILSDKLPLGAPIRKYDLKGAKVQGYLAPDISKSNLGNVPVDEIVDVFLKDKMIGGGEIQGPMLEVNRDSLRYLTRSDLEAIAVYLKNVESKPLPKPKGGAGVGTYETYCSGCHTAGAGGAPRLGDATAWTPLLKAGLPKVYENAIKGINGMPAKGTCMSCSDDDIKQAVDYMVAAVKDGGSAAHAPQKPLTAADGKRIYETNCASCHTSETKGAPKTGDQAAWQPIIDAGFVDAYLSVVNGKNGHPVMGSCKDCNDADIKAAVKYMLNQSASDKNFDLW